MSLTNPNKPVTEARLQEFYHRIKSYLGFTEMPSEDMDDVISPLPSVQPRYHKYSTEEHIVGEWIDGKPIYEKTIVSNWDSQQTLTTNTWTNLDLSNMPLNIDTLVNSELLFNGPNSKNNYLFNISYSVNSNGINYYTTISYNFVQLRLTIQYTKSE